MTFALDRDDPLCYGDWDWPLAPSNSFEPDDSHSHSDPIGCLAVFRTLIHIEGILSEHVLVSVVLLVQLCPQFHALSLSCVATLLFEYPIQRTITRGRRHVAPS